MFPACAGKSKRPFYTSSLLLLIALLLSGCLSPRVSQSTLNINIHITADGKTQNAQVSSGSTVAQALDSAGVKLGSLDKVDPPAYTVLSDGGTITVTRVQEKFETKDVVLPFEHQTVRNESMPQGETRLIQPGVNGSQELTYRHVYEDGAEVSDNVVKTVTLQAAVPEIVMVGVQTPFTPLPIVGKLVYIAGGNAWLMEDSTANRIPLVTSGDLDGRILRLSADGDWLLYTRKSDKPADQEINRLWALNFADPQAKPIDLGVPNVIHFADFDPNDALTVDYSTVEPRTAAPGWQANNNLFRRKFGKNGVLGIEQKIIDANTGGLYGWWGTDFSWAPDGSALAYSRPDGVGLVSFKHKQLVPLLDITPLETHSDWALLPGLAWGADSNILYVVTHAPPPGLVNPEESPYFDLSALSLVNSANVDIVQQSGMFAYPSASPLRGTSKAQSYSVAYLQALLPSQSDTSGYRLVVMDRDGSNRRVLFPDEGSPGLQPQTPVWAPAALSATQGNFVAVVYQGNLWFIDVDTGQPHQVTGDGLIQKIDWR